MCNHGRKICINVEWSVQKPILLLLSRIFCKVAVLSICLFVASPIYGNERQGNEAFVRGDFATSLKEYRLRAEQGDPEAQAFLGIHYEFGMGIKRNYVEATKWYRKSAEQGHYLGQLQLAQMYFFGRGVEKNYEIGMRWLHKSVNQGWPDA